MHSSKLLARPGCCLNLHVRDSLHRPRPRSQQTHFRRSQLSEHTSRASASAAATDDKQAHSLHNICTCSFQPACNSRLYSCSGPSASPLQGHGTWRCRAAQAVGAFLIATCLAGQQPAAAEIQTVTAGEATGLAKPLPKQGVKKGKVWAIFIGGAVSIFATTVLLENNERLFPAIKKANVASQMARQRMQEAQQKPAGSVIDTEAVPQDISDDENARLQAAVVAGINSARKRELGKGLGIVDKSERKKQDEQAQPASALQAAAAEPPSSSSSETEAQSSAQGSQAQPSQEGQGSKNGSNGVSIESQNGNSVDFPDSGQKSQADWTQTKGNRAAQ